MPTIADATACAPGSDDYPLAAARAEATGTTRIRFTVDAEGRLANAEIIQSAGATREHRLLDRTALRKLRDCRFQPGRDAQGRAIGGSFEVEYLWRLQ